MTPAPLSLSLPISRPVAVQISNPSLSKSSMVTFPMPHSASTESMNEQWFSNRIPPRPRSFSYSITALFELPRRLLRPPNARKRACEPWTVAPEMNVSLEDILNMRHVSPLSLKDFEQYLLFEEYGAENLYFTLWLRDYTTRHNAGASAAQLALSVSRAKATFFTSDSQYELNLAAPRVAQLFATAGHTAELNKTRSVDSKGALSVRELTFVPPDPAVFAQVSNDVEHMLRLSARRFVRARSRNVSSQRALCVVFGGIQTIALAGVPLLVSFLLHRGRWIRLAMFPPLWMGLMVMICSLNGLCIVVYLMGGSRQLHPFELNRPPISAPLPKTPHSPYGGTSTTPNTVQKVGSPSRSAYPPSLCTTNFVSPSSTVHGPFDANGKQVSSPVQKESYVLPPIRPTSPIGDLFEFETAGFIPCHISDTASTYTQTDIESAIASSLTYVDSSYGITKGGSAQRSVFDFDALPLKTLDSTTGPRVMQAARGRGVKGMIGSAFAPLTQIESPVVSRAQWEIVIRSAALATVISSLVTAAFTAVPASV